MIKVIASQLLPADIINRLKEYNVECIPAGHNSLINNETAYHPDMLYFKLTNGKILSAIRNDPLVNNLDTILTKSVIKDGYPNDCSLNCFFAKNCLICGVSAAQEIVNDAKNNNMEIRRVKQGYAACSTVKVTDSAFISSDTGIVKALIATKHDALLVSNEGIILNGYNCGFIGGCALSVDNKIFFTGKIENHKDYNNIKSFANNHGKTIVSLCDQSLYDYGGFIVL